MSRTGFKDFSDFEYCHLKSVNRTYKYFSLKVNLFKIPVSKIKVNIELLKRFSGYKPFLYNVTFDGCQFLEKPKSSPVAFYFYNFIKIFSNMNHSCPYNHDLIVDKLLTQHVNYQFTKVLPFPEGDYMWKTNWMAYGINRAVVKLYVSFSSSYNLLIHDALNLALNSRQPAINS
uniref:Uncharacterized protein LOC108048600 n=2 Tax=Drosophila rhopaloa TaxID=1041015 RepID=A0A6P4FAH8_DRORH